MRNILKMLSTLKRDISHIFKLTGRRLIYPDRRSVVFCYDVGICMISMQLAYWLYYGENQIYFSEFFILKQMAIYGCLCAGSFTLLQTYRPLWKYLNLVVVTILIVSVLIASSLHSVLEWRLNVENIRIHPMLSFIAGGASIIIMVVSRLIYKFSLRWTLTEQDDEVTSISDSRILVYGHIDDVRNYLESVKQFAHNQINILGIICEQPENVGQMLGGYPIVCTLKDLEDYIIELNAEGQHPHKLLITNQNMRSSLVRKLFDLCWRHNIYLQKIPSPQDITHEGVLPIKLELQDLFSDPIYMDEDSALEQFYSQQNILIIGAGGIIGLNLIKQLLDLKVKSLIICESDQGLLAELKDDNVGQNMHFILTKGYTVKHYDHILAQYKPNILINLDSVTQQDVAYDNPLETLYENLLVPVSLAELAQKYNVRYFINTRHEFLSDDPTVITPLNNILEAWCQQKDDITQPTRFITVHLPVIIFQQDEWIRCLRSHAKQGRRSSVNLKPHLSNLMAPKNAAFSLLSIIYLFTQTTLEKTSLLQVKGVTCMPDKLMMIVKNLFHLSYIAINTMVERTFDDRFITSEEKINVDGEIILTSTLQYSHQTKDINNLVDDLNVTYQQFDKQTVLALILNNKVT